jgi:methylase of polypeptide subunit release factors
VSDLVQRGARVRDAFTAIGFTATGVLDRLGPAALDAWRRDHAVPARRALHDDHDDLAAAIRLLMLGEPLADAASLRELPVDDLHALGIVSARGGMTDPVLRVQPMLVERVGSADLLDRWLVSDHLRERPLPDDHVLGAGGAASTLSQLAVRREVGRVLDLGTGSGVQLLHLAGRTQHLVGTDTNQRALDLASLSMALNGINAELRQGDRFDPVADERFDLIVSNPPLVVGPAARFEYRDSGLEGDAMCAALVADATRHLTEGGFAQLLANWLHVEGQDWRERVASWLPADADAWIVQRELLDPAQYVEMWLADGGDLGTPAYDTHYDDWLTWFEQHRITGVGMGWITLRRTDGIAVRRIEELRQAVEQPAGRWIPGLIEAWSREQAADDDVILAARLGIADGVVLEQHLVPDRAVVGGGWSPGTSRLVQHAGARRTGEIDPFGVLVMGGLDGSRTVAEAVAEAGSALGLPLTAGLREAAVDAVRGLLVDGYLVHQFGRSV